MSSENLPLGNAATELVVRSAAEVGDAVRSQRKRLALTQADIAGLGGIGNRFLVELENGKPTVQLQKVLDVMDLLGLELVLRPRTPRLP
ncbi:helix-turn-helix transcriptional regulator [Derxia lacustris]|uniref:helix-turn-helix transcriptional regulator n=1 Tax=Derxia lacustris TaxID=764842 RepID=UPI000A172AC0|nr:helix-turn-helix transcriptional regulator [Derxia lacustris]